MPTPSSAVPAGITIRPETPDDHAAVAAVVGAAFGDDAHPRLVAELRSEPSYRPARALVAVEGAATAVGTPTGPAAHGAGIGGADVAPGAGAVVGYVLVTDSTVTAADGTVRRVATLSPLAVTPDRQRAGIGAALVAAVVAACAADGEPAVLLEGDPGYYGRLGFEPAAPHGYVLPLPDWAPAEAAQVHRLAAWAARTVGVVAYSPPFDRFEG